MRDVLGTIGFFVAASGTFRLLYGSWPPSEGNFLAWLTGDSTAQWSFAASVVAGMVGASIGRRLSPRESDSRIIQAKEYARQGRAFHNARQIDKAVDMFSRAIGLYAEASRTVAAAPVYASLGKLYFDVEQLDLAEKNLDEALTLFKQWPEARGEIHAATLLLEVIWARRRVSPLQSTYTDSAYGFSLTIPANWGPQKLMPEFVRSGGRVAFSHRSNAATFNVSVGPLVEPELRLPEVRVVSAKEYLLKTHERVSDIDARTFGPVNGETNVVAAEYDTRTLVGGALRQRRNGFVSVVHDGLEFVFQWSAEAEYEAETRGIVASFVFDAAGGGAMTSG